MRTTRSRETYVQARDLTPGMKVQRNANHLATRPVDQIVLKVERAADLVPKLQEQVAKAKTKVKIRAAADALVRALDAMEYEGREARMVTLRFFGSDGHARESTVAMGSQDELRYVGQATVTERRTA